MRTFSGIISELLELHKDRPVINITGNRCPSDFYGTYSSIIDYKYDGLSYCSSDSPNSFICFEFISHRVSIEAYLIRSSNLVPLEGLQTWVIEGSNDFNEKNWILLDSVSNYPSLCYESQVCSFFITDEEKKKQKFRFIRLRMTGKNSRNYNVLSITNIEFFGDYSS